MWQKTSMALGLLTASVMWSSASAAQTCPSTADRHEKDDIFYESPRERLLKGSVAAGRTCMSIVPTYLQGQHKREACPAGYSFERASVLYPSPRERLLSKLTKEEDRFCVGVVKPNSGALGVSRPAITLLGKLNHAVLTGQDLVKTSTTNAQSCEQSCRTLALCAAWSWKAADKSCALKSQAGDLQFSANAASGWSSQYFKRQLGSGTQAKPNFVDEDNSPGKAQRLFGVKHKQQGLPKHAQILKTMPRASLDDCAMLCAAEKSVVCSAFTYDQGSNSCSIYKPGASFFDSDIKATGWVGVRRTPTNPEPPVRSGSAKRSSGEQA